MSYLKKTLKSVLFVIILLIVILFIRPQRIYNEPKITGKVLDKNNKPIVCAKVYRITKVSKKNKDYGYFETIEEYTGEANTDNNGNFIIEKDSYIKWFQTPFDLKTTYCCTKIEVNKDGYVAYISDDKNFEIIDNENVACKGIEFKPKITLEKIN
jgi:hypothetical protein